MKILVFNHIIKQCIHLDYNRIIQCGGIFQPYNSGVTPLDIMLKDPEQHSWDDIAIQFQYILHEIPLIQG